MPYIDFDRFHELVSLADTVKALGLMEGRLNVLWKRAACPLCHHSDFRCFSVNWEKNEFKCQRCGRKGGPLQFAGYVLGMEPYRAALEICRRLNIPVPEKASVPKGRPRRDASGELHGGDDDEDEVE